MCKVQARWWWFGLTVARLRFFWWRQRFVQGVRDITNEYSASRNVGIIIISKLLRFLHGSKRKNTSAASGFSVLSLISSPLFFSLLVCGTRKRDPWTRIRITNQFRCTRSRSGSSYTSKTVGVKTEFLLDYQPTSHWFWGLPAAKEATVRKIEQIVKSRFSEEISARESELDTINQVLECPCSGKNDAFLETKFFFFFFRPLKLTKRNIQTKKRKGKVVYVKAYRRLLQVLFYMISSSVSGLLLE